MRLIYFFYKKLITDNDHFLFFLNKDNGHVYLLTIYKNKITWNFHNRPY